MRLSIPWARPLAATLVVLMALTAAAPLASADPRATGATTTAPSKRLSASAASVVARLHPAPRAFAQAGAAAAPASTDSSGSFFRSKTGVAAIVLMVAGAGYVAYSIGHDNKKVHSPIR